ncbi:S26 family signal peptidase [Amycolatopsis vastitatis]|nr:S26 family signal peptidase [Amycolatopsis vastitatis]
MAFTEPPDPGCARPGRDNRPASWDSRHYGFVPRDRMVGVVVRLVSRE